MSIRGLEHGVAKHIRATALEGDEHALFAELLTVTTTMQSSATLAARPRSTRSCGRGEPWSVLRGLTGLVGLMGLMGLTGLTPSRWC